MNLVPVKCPNCGGTIQAPENTNMCYCTFCGSQLFIDNDSKTITYRVIDEAKIHETESKEFLEYKRLELEAKERASKRKLLIAVAIVLAVLTAVGIFLVWFHYHVDDTAPVLGVGMLLAFFPGLGLLTMGVQILEHYFPNRN